VLVLTFKALHGIGLGYLRDCLSLITSAHPIRSSERYAVGLVSQRTTLGGMEEGGLLCLGDHPMEHSPPSEVSSIPPYFPEVPEDLALSSGLGVSGDW